MAIYLTKLALYFIFIVFPFLVMLSKGRKYARIQATLISVVGGSLFWFSFTSWALLGVGGHGLIALPMPNVIAVPIWYFYGEMRGAFNIPYDVMFPQAYWIIPCAQLATFYMSYGLSFKKVDA